MLAWGNFQGVQRSTIVRCRPLTLAQGGGYFQKIYDPRWHQLYNAELTHLWLMAQLRPFCCKVFEALWIWMVLWWFCRNWNTAVLRCAFLSWALLCSALPWLSLPCHTLLCLGLRSVCSPNLSVWHDLARWKSLWWRRCTLAEYIGNIKVDCAGHPDWTRPWKGFIAVECNLGLRTLLKTPLCPSEQHLGSCSPEMIETCWAIKMVLGSCLATVVTANF